jgi:hypothetical protein
LRRPSGAYFAFSWARFRNKSRADQATTPHPRIYDTKNREFVNLLNANLFPKHPQSPAIDHDVNTNGEK